MNGAQDHCHQATTTNAANRFPQHWMEDVRLTMVQQEAIFQQQLHELHRIYNKQRELMDELRFARSKRVKKPKLDAKTKQLHSNDQLIEVQDQVATPVSPETANSSTAQGKQDEEAAKSAAVVLVAMAMSSTSLPAAADESQISNADLASVQQRTQPSKMPDVIDVASGQRSRQQMKIPSQHENPPKKRKRMNDVAACIGRTWGIIKNGRRSQRKRAHDPLHTFLRGGLMCRWR